MLLTLAGLLVVAVAAIFVTLPMLRPGAGADGGALSDGAESSARRALEHDKRAALAAIKDAEFDHSVGKLSDADYARLRAELEEQALRAMASLDVAAAPEQAGGAPGEPPRTDRAARGGTHTAFCADCGAALAAGVRFCAACGKGRAGARGGAAARKRA